MARARLATVWLDGCSGCHMSFLDLDEVLLDLAARVDLVYSPLVDAKTFPEDVDVTLVEGAVSSSEDLEKIQHIRRHTRRLIALGDCAVTGNVPSMRNMYPVSAVLARAYTDTAQIPGTPRDAVPALLPVVRPVHLVVPVDVVLPGCPPPAALIKEVLLAVLDGTTPNLKARFG
ncbi:MAG: NADP oxidoreductase [Anaerolineae bacterium]|nr:NADP oxidoreductase [Anaerolineae bacterium]